MSTTGGAPSFWVIPATLALAFMAIGPFAAQSGLASPFAAFKLYLLSLAFGLVAVLHGFWVALAREKSPGLISIAVGLLPFLVAGFSFVRAGKDPRINDVTTDLNDPPSFVIAQSAAENQGKSLAFPEPFKPIVASEYSELRPQFYPRPASEVFKAALAVASGAEVGWAVTGLDEGTLTFEATHTAGIFRFVDDIAVRVRAAKSASGEEGARIDARSRSRVGQSDFGANAARIKSYFEALDRLAQSNSLKGNAP